MMSRIGKPHVMVDVGCAPVYHGAKLAMEETPESSFVVPKPSTPQAELRAMLGQSAELLAMAHDLDRSTWFTHPFLGPMQRDQALKFVLVHNRHHLKIVSDILKQQR